MPKRIAAESHAFWRLKGLRELKGITLEALAQRTGLTKSYLSKVERGVSVPSIAAALKLAEAFEVGVGELFGLNAQVTDYAVVRKNERQPFSRRLQSSQRDGKDDYSYEAIAPGLSPGLFEAFIMHPPRKEPPRPKARHSGREMIFVLKGRIQVNFPHTAVKLSGGDTIAFNGQLPHHIVSLGKQRAETLVIIANDKAEPRKTDR